MKTLPIFNPELSFIRHDWQGNPVNDQNQYINLDGPSERSYGDLLKWQFGPKPMKALKKNQSPGINVIKNADFINDRSDGITWLGHASFVFTLQGKHFIADPVLYNISLLKRCTELPCPTSQFRQIDYILLSHNHRDHCDKKSLQELCTLNPKAIIITGLAIADLLRSWSIGNRIIEMGWYQQFRSEEGIAITYLPAKHWNRRGLRDLNNMLWGSFMLQSETRNIYFGADSGLGKHFQEIGKLFPRIDFALIGIGAYMPEWFMHPSHTSPAEALEACKCLGASKLVPMHHGTFDLSDEPIYYPKQELTRLASERTDISVLQLDIGGKHYCDG